MTKTGDFTYDVRNGYYTWIQNQRWFSHKEPAELKNYPDTWHDDFMTYLIDQGVPACYASKVASCAWQMGHSSGYTEVLNVSYDLVEIFTS